MAPKRKVTITLDDELVGELKQAGNVSAQRGDAGWALVERQRRAERLAALLDEFDATDGSLPTDPDEDARLERLLGGAA